jgi:pimeloyl-ACP methyl ester carboxylesterase
VVYLHHGLLMNSEVWVCLTDEQRALPFVLVEKGFDVWVGSTLPGTGNMVNRTLTTAVWEQPRQQVLQKVHLLVTKLAQVLELLHRRVRLP